MVSEFGAGDQKLQSVYRAPFANWESGKLKMHGDVEKVSLVDGQIAREVVSGFEIAEDSDPFDEIRGKPSHLKVGELERRSEKTESDVERRSFDVAVQKRYSTPFLPLIIALFTAPFALSLSRKGKVVTIGYAIGLWLLFIGSTSIFAQFGESGSLSPLMAVWSPLLLFSMLGVYLLSKVRT